MTIKQELEIIEKAEKYERIRNALNEYIIAYYVKNASLPTQEELDKLANAIL